MTDNTRGAENDDTVRQLNLTNNHIHTPVTGGVEQAAWLWPCHGPCSPATDGALMPVAPPATR